MKEALLIMLSLSIIQFGCKTNKFASQELIDLTDRIICTLEVKEDTLRLNDQISIAYEVTNTSEETVYVNTCGGYYINGVKFGGGYNIQVKNELGEVMLRQPSIGIGGGRCGFSRIEPKASIKINVRDLHSYRISDQAGTYEIKIDNQLEVYKQLKKRKTYGESSKDFRQHFLVFKSNVTTLTILE